MSRKILAVPGALYGSLTVVKECKVPEGIKTKQVFWECMCLCGRAHVARSVDIRKGVTTQCSKCTRTLAGSNRATHGMIDSRAYNTWYGMKSRCMNPNDGKYHRYGGRGISVCAEWRDSFESFLLDMGEPPEGMSIDREDNEKGYFKENCRWATVKQQNRNRRSNVPITINGKTMILVEWCEHFGIDRTTVSARMKKGLSPEQALSVRPI